MNTFKQTPVRNIVHSNKPKCKDCKYSMKVKVPEILKHKASIEEDIIVCKLFRYSFGNAIKDYNHYVDIDLCRDDPELCGPDATYFKQI